tara:strand:+ start:5475 stop:5831 length:357 start_codon:yes stop_codon:yes gene_type:complete
MNLIFENKYRNIKVYKYQECIKKNSNIGNILLNGLLHWDTISDEEVQSVKNILTNNSIGFKGYTIKDAIVLENADKNIHYYAYFNNENIELWYISGIYDMVICDDDINFNELLFIIQN